MLKILFLVMVFQLDDSLNAPYQKAKIRLLSVYCDSNPDYINNVTCELKPISRHLKSLKFGYNFYRPIPTLWIRIRNLKKTSANRYMPGFFDVKQDLCKLMTSQLHKTFFRNFLEAFVRNDTEEVMQQIKKCPFEGGFSINKVYDETETPPSIFFEPAEYRIETTLYSSENVTYLTWRVNSVINN